MPFAPDKSVMCSNFIGEAIDIALELGFESVLIVGHIGKLVKLGAGIMNTHSKQADGRMDVLVTCGVLADVDVNILKKLPDCATVDAALAELDKVGKIEDTAKILMKRTQHYLDAKVKGEMKVVYKRCVDILNGFGVNDIPKPLLESFSPRTFHTMKVVSIHNIFDINNTIF